MAGDQYNNSPIIIVFKIMERNAAKSNIVSVSLRVHVLQSWYIPSLTNFKSIRPTQSGTIRTTNTLDHTSFN